MTKAAFVGFGEVNTPKELIVKKCADALALLEKEGVECISVFPVTDDYEEKDVNMAIDALKGKEFDYLVVCVAGFGVVCVCCFLLYKLPAPTSPSY